MTTGRVCKNGLVSLDLGRLVPFFVGVVGEAGLRYARLVLTVLYFCLFNFIFVLLKRYHYLMHGPL